VLPFKLLSDEPEKQYLADGMMDAILLHLSKIEDLRVMSRTSTEQYKESGKTMTEIGKELGVAYLLEGSFQKFGDDVRLIVQLIQAGKEGHVWANKYDRKWNDIFSVQSEVAQAIASEVNVEITPEEKQLIEKTPTTSLTAYDFFQRGREEYWKGEIEKAEDFYKKALVYDSTFAQAYTGLAWVYWDKHFWGTILSDDFMDSVLIFCDIALSYDDHLSEAYNIRGLYYDAAGEPEQAVKEIDKALALNPNDWMAYYIKGNIYMWVLEDFVISIKNLHEAVSRNRGEGLPDLLGSLARAYLDIGFVDKARHFHWIWIHCFISEDQPGWNFRLEILKRLLNSWKRPVKLIQQICGQIIFILLPGNTWKPM
jgi:TolB-like protein